MGFMQNIKMKMVLSKINKGNIDGALKILSSIKYNSNEKMLYEGICHYEKGDMESAQVLLENVYLLNKDYNCARILFEVYLQKKEIDKAKDIIKAYDDKKEVKQLLKIFRDKNALENYIKKNELLARAANYIRIKQFTLSIEEYLLALEYSDDKAQIYNQIGAIYLNYIKDKNMAEQYFDKAYKIEPDNKVYKMNYAKIKLS